MLVTLAACLPFPGAQAADKKPTILVIWSDDIGQFHVSAYNRGMMGYKTPNIASIANQGALFTDWYGAIKAAPPGAPEGMKKEDPTIADLLKAQGYMAGQFGKNHLGDRDDMLPTSHGFDEFFGNLYHLNAEEEPENPDCPKDPAFKKRYGPRGIIHSCAGGKIEDTGPLTNLRMDPFELAPEIGMDYDRWFAERMFLFASAAGYIGQWLQSFKEFPPRQKPASFNLDNVMEAVTAGSAGKQ